MEYWITKGRAFKTYAKAVKFNKGKDNCDIEYVKNGSDYNDAIERIEKLEFLLRNLIGDSLDYRQW